MKHKYKVRLTKMVNAWMEMSADAAEEAEDKAFDEVLRLDRDIGCGTPWFDDGDIQVEDDTLVFDGESWQPVKAVPRERGGEKESPEDETVKDEASPPRPKDGPGDAKSAKKILGPFGEEMFKGHTAEDDMAMLTNVICQMRDALNATAYDDRIDTDYGINDVLGYISRKYKGRK